ncbi:MAG: hypothetical protein NTZ03_02485 [Actinobacteria bacterium]|nr:hypothetical protein [Actinomycetota bacterium]
MPTERPDAALDITVQLAGLPDRLEHSRVVESAAKDLVARDSTLGPEIRVAARLHDIGYAVSSSGLHQLDGAAYLQSHGVDALTVGLVAFHTGAEFEAVERGLSDPLSCFVRPPQHLIDAITLCDLTTGPTGVRVSPTQRLAEILIRYPADHVVHRSISRASRYLLECCERARARSSLPDVWLGAPLKAMGDPQSH